MNDSPRLRLSILGFVAFMLFTALVARLYYLQVLEETDFEAVATANIEREVLIPASRGRVLDSKGRVLVDNRVSNVVTVDKAALRDVLVDVSERTAMVERLAGEISKTGHLTKVRTIQEALDDPKFGPFDRVPIVEDVDEEFTVFLGERFDEFIGVEVAQVSVREYPFGDLGAHVLGFVGPIDEEELEAFANKEKTYHPNDDIGKSGVELVFEDELRGTPGRRVIKVDGSENFVEELAFEEPVAGNDIRLTLDIELQAYVETELEAQIRFARTQVDNTKDDRPPEFFNAPAGAAVVLDPNNGAVLAMASHPTYDPSDFIGGISVERFEEYREDVGAPLNNRAIQGVYPPGSTFKPFTAYAALNSGLLGPRGVFSASTFTPDPGFYELQRCLGNCTFTNANSTPYGDVDLRRALTVSSDVYFYKLAEAFEVRAGVERIAIQDNARLFGYGESSGVPLPFEHPGRLPTPESRQAQHDDNPIAFPNPEWTTGDTLNTSIGQGEVGATPLQMANAYAVLANGGTLYAPALVTDVLNPATGETVKEFGPRVRRELYWPDRFTNPILEGLLGVTRSQEGTGFDAFTGFDVFAWPVAGKTGTSEVGTKSDFALFGAFGPMPNPDYVAFAVLEEAGFGGEIAAPLVRRILEGISNDTVPPIESALDENDIYIGYESRLDRDQADGIDVVVESSD